MNSVLPCVVFHTLEGIAVNWRYLGLSRLCAIVAIAISFGRIKHGWLTAYDEWTYHLLNLSKRGQAQIQTICPELHF